MAALPISFCDGTAHSAWDSGPGGAPDSDFGPWGGPVDGMGMVAPAGGVAVGAPADGMAVEWPADGVAVEIGGVSETRERRLLRRGTFSMAGRHTRGSRAGEREKLRGGKQRTRCRVKRESDGGTQRLYT